MNCDFKALQRCFFPAILMYNLENKPHHGQRHIFEEAGISKTSLFLYDMRGQLTWLAPMVKEDVHNYAALLATSDHVAQLAKQFFFHWSLLCGLRTGKVYQSCLTDVLGVSPYGR